METDISRSSRQPCCPSLFHPRGRAPFALLPVAALPQGTATTSDPVIAVKTWEWHHNRFISGSVQWNKIQDMTIFDTPKLIVVSRAFVFLGSISGVIQGHEDNIKQQYKPHVLMHGISSTYTGISPTYTCFRLGCKFWTIDLY